MPVWPVRDCACLLYSFVLFHFVCQCKNHFSPANTKSTPIAETITTKMSELALIHKKAINTIKSSDIADINIIPLAFTSFLKCLKTPQ
jgi:hypothetical protein